MKAHISTIIQVNDNHMWNELQKISSLVYVTSPLLNFKSLDSGDLPEKWEIDKQYSFLISAFHIVPLGKHYIILNKIDEKKKEILSSENGTLTKEWNHKIMVEKINENTLKYTDEIEIKAGLLTLFVWLFSHIFYRHRQRRWKQLLSRKAK